MNDTAAVVCSICAVTRGSEDAARALAWVREHERGRTRWLCPCCARDHVRDIEGKLPSEYW